MKVKATIFNILKSSIQMRYFAIDKFFFIVVIVTAALFLLPKSVFASTLYLSPGSAKVGVGSTVTVQVRLNAGGDAVNGVSAFLSYPADKLDVVRVSPSGTFSIGAENTYGGGIIKISRGSFSGVTGNVSVASIAFRGKAEGTATVAFIGGSQAPRASDSSDSLSLGGSAGATFTISKFAPAPSSTTTQTATTSAVQDPIISDVVVSSVGTNSATIAWKTDKLTDSYIEYGLDTDNYFLNASNGNLVTDHSIKLEGPILQPGTKFHFRVKSKDEKDNMGISNDLVFQLLGYQVKIIVVDDAGDPLSNQEVWFYSDPQKGVTDTKGEVVFDNITPGKHLVVVKLDGGEKTSEITVENTGLPVSIAGEVAGSQVSQPQTQIIKVSPITQPQSTNLLQSSYLVPGIIGVGVLIVAALIIFLLRRRGKKPPQSPPATTTNTNNPVSNVSNMITNLPNMGSGNVNSS